MQTVWQQFLRRETELYQCEYRIRDREGQNKWVSAQVQAI
jgi:hypothetical protein